MGQIVRLIVLFIFPILVWADPRICLTLIVKDNLKTIEDCLKSVEGIVDCVCICDVGSTDGTSLEIDKFIKESKIPVKIFKHDFVNYGYNRTLSVQAAQTALNQWGADLDSSYLLILDPQMRLHTSADFQKKKLTEDAYAIWVESIPLVFGRYEPCLLRAGLNWQGDGAAYDILSCKEADEPALLYTLKVIEIDDQEKLEEAADLLIEALKDEPCKCRNLFYLALVLHSLENYSDAVRCFEHYLDQDAPKEEIWFAKYMIGHCYEKAEEWDKALFWYLEAYQADVNRAESLQKIANYYRLKGFNELGHLFSKHGSRIPFYEDFSLSPLPCLSDYQFDEELSISSYYTRFKQDGYQAVNQLLLRKNVPWAAKDQAYRNLLFYIHRLPQARYIPIEIEFPRIRKDRNERYHPMNPSILSTQKGYRVICRTVNYTQKGAKNFDTIDPNGVFRTRNFLIEYDRDFNILSHTEIIEELERKKTRAFHYLDGLDDCRIFQFQGKTWFTCNTSDTSPRGKIEISLCSLADSPSGKKIYVDTLTPLLGPDPARTEKNWLPFIQDNAIHVLYSYDPLVIYRVDPTTGACQLSHRFHPALDFSRFRGSAGPIAWDDGYLIVVHEVVFFADHSRVYVHRFLKLDKSFTPTHLSDPFIFKNQGVEFCSGMTLDHAGNELILTLGIEDREALLCMVSADTVLSLLYPLPKLEH